jgi:signal transduction histidine kinase
LLFAGILYWLGESLEKTLFSAHLEVARHSNLMAVYAVETSMMTDSVHQPWDLMAERIPHDEGTEISIVDPQGVVLFSTVPNERGSIRATVDATFVGSVDDSRHVVFTSPLRNADSCRKCHQSGNETLGTVTVRHSLEPIDEQIRNIQAGIAVAGGIALLMTTLTTTLLLGRYLGRPLRRLLAGARAIGAGNLKHTVELPERSELTVLADTLNASTARLSALQEELVRQERLAAVGETVAGLAHCLKNALNGLRGGQYVIDRAVELGDAERLRKGWRVMKSGVAQVEGLTFDMLYYIKEREPERKPTDVNQVVLEIIDLLRESAKGQGVDLRSELDPEIGEEALDRTLIYRAVLNLATNAIDACTESESGDLVVLQSRLTAPGEIVLTVQDNGVGMSEEIRSRLFTRFFSTKATRGTGLGLSVVKKIAEEHGGSVEVQSEPGRGSIFQIHLPRATA